ncbi:ADP-ribosylglycohydrolase family protein [Halorubrum ezzemoulense]|nr:ADP-ribosylglycohydrolase family protein [Halorubrum ezzemoulense]MDB2276614.1 ADP-ribosylglycohydrolase family protein [Halorubrum ezzemoulense]
MALCIARSLVELGCFDPDDVADRFVEWYQSGPFDIGILTSTVLRRLRDGDAWDEAGIDEWKHLPEGSNAGNGSVMRCAPYAIAFAGNPDELVTVSRISSAITHADPRCQWGCGILNATLAGLLTGADQPLASALELTTDAPAELRSACETVQAIVEGSESVGDIDLANSGYVVTTLQAGLYHGLTAESAEGALVDAVMLGGDTDTIAAVAGAVAGARFGASELPDRWLQAIDETDEITNLGRRLEMMDVSLPAPVVESLSSGKFDLQA